jgi:hypothetical protein
VPEQTIAVGELSVAESVVEADAHYIVGGVLMIMRSAWFRRVCFGRQLQL